MPHHRGARTSLSRALVTGALTALLVVAVPAGDVRAEDASLPLGDSDLTEARTQEILAPGVTMVTIRRGDVPAPEGEAQTTSRGPWVVRALVIDPTQADGQLVATLGTDLSTTQRTSEMVGLSGALAGVNASYFNFGGTYPGDPVGVSVSRGRILSEPSPEAAEADVVLDPQTGRFALGRLRWSGRLHNRRTGRNVTLRHLDHAPVVPKACARLRDQTRCRAAGDTVLFQPEWGAATPAGLGIEVVLDSRGCVVRRAARRGTHLAAGQTSVQATGRDSVTLRRRTRRGCLTPQSTLSDPAGHVVPMTSSTYVVNGRYQLLSAGRVTAPSGDDPFFARHARTLVGRAQDGRIMLATIDGGRSTSVGATLTEAAGVAQALGMYDAVNLDGGGSTTMAVRGELVNQPAGSQERSVGDALVYLPAG